MWRETPAAQAFLVLYETLWISVRKGLGAQGRDRTTDTVIFSHVLYQLSYLGAEARRAGGVVKARGYRGSLPGCPAKEKLSLFRVMPGLEPGIPLRHARCPPCRMAGSSPAMTRI